MASGQTQKFLMAKYPCKVEKCPHEVASARRLGNSHGRFLECVDCGVVKRALDQDYQVPLNNAKVPVYAMEHSYRLQPGGKMVKI